jgi:hypothetical protein
MVYIIPVIRQLVPSSGKGVMGMAKARKARQDQMSLRDANYGPVQLDNTKGRMVAVENPPGASFTYTDEGGKMCVIRWEEAIKQFGPPNNRA